MIFLFADEMPVVLSEITKILVDIENAFFYRILDMLPESQHLFYSGCIVPSCEN